MTFRYGAVLCVVGLIAFTSNSRASVSGALTATESALGDIVKKSDGSVLHMNQYEAETYCSDKGGLPTARQLAEESQRFGANGILETKYVGVSIDSNEVKAEINQMLQDYYYPIYAKNNSDQIVVDFYFNKRGYIRPPGKLGNYWFWSSSLLPFDSVNAYELSGVDGGIDYASRHIDGGYSAARCAR